MKYIHVWCECGKQKAFQGKDVDDLDTRMVRAGWNYLGGHIAKCPECQRREDREYHERYGAGFEPYES